MEKQIVRVDRYNANKAVRISNDLFDVSKCIMDLGSVHAVKLLYALAQSVQGRDIKEFPVLDFSIDAAFDYLGIQKSNNRHVYLRDALDSILRNGLSIARTTKRNSITYTGVNWISFYEFSTDKDRVVITLNPHAEPYLLQLSQFAVIRPQMYMKLKTSYQAWLYPYLVNRKNLGVWTESIETLKTMLGLSDSVTYNHSSIGTNRFLSKVMGITISEAYKRELALAKSEKRKVRFVPWDYTTDKDGKPIGTLYNINAHTDLEVKVSPLKTGRSYTHLVFEFGDAPRSSTTTIQEDLFDSNFSVMSTPASLPVEQEYTEEDARDLYQSMNPTEEFTFEKFLKAARMEYRDGKYYRITGYI